MVSEEGTSKSLEHYNIINYSSSAFPATFEGSDCTGTYSISECFCCCLSSSISILEGCDIVIILFLYYRLSHHTTYSHY